VSPRRKPIPGITVYRLKSSWAYRVTGPPDPVTGQRKRPYKGGFATEDEAWRAALDAQRLLDVGRPAHTKRIRVEAFLDEWLHTIEPDLKETTLQSYRDIIGYYLRPTIGPRWLGDITVPTLNALYRRLLDSGRLKGDANWRMYSYWLEHQSDRDGRGPRAGDMAAACGTTLNAAREALRRYRRGRVPKEYAAGLSPKSVKNIHVLLHKAFSDAVAWGYLRFNPAEHAVVPRARRRDQAPVRRVWTIEELGRWLAVASQDRFAGMWLLAATTGMRRSELAGVRRDMLDLKAGVLRVEDTRVVVAGRSHHSDGKTAAGRRGISLDTFTCAELANLLDLLDKERAAFGSAYPDHGLLMVNEEGRPLHPDSITARFNRLVDRAGVPHIRLHDVRHTYATLAMDLGIDPKMLSDRIGHANTSVTLQIYTHRSAGRDQAMAQTLGEMIQAAIGSRLLHDASTGQDSGPNASDSPSGEEPQK